MEDAVLFRSMIESLSPKEFNTFSTNLFATFNQRELLTKSLFHLLAYYSRNALNTKYKKNINNILLNIIHDRKNKNTHEQNKHPDINTNQNHNENNNQTEISDIPYPLIAKCASYLNTSEVTNFQYCNRHIYISCKKNSISMTELVKYNWFKKYTNNNFGSVQSRIKYLSRFNMIQTLNFHLNDWNTITNDNQNPQHFVFKNVNKLVMTGNSVKFKPLANTLPPFNKLKYLTFNISECNISDIASFLSNNTQISFLNFVSQAILANNEQNQQSVETFPFNQILNNLRGIKIYDFMDPINRAFFDTFLSIMAHKLHSCHQMSIDIIRPNYESIWNTSGNYKFNNLKELCLSIYKLRDDTVCDFLTPLSVAIKECDLEKLNIWLRCGMITPYTDDEWLEMVAFIQYILESKKNLKYMSISGDNGNILCCLAEYFTSKSEKLQNNNGYANYASIKVGFSKWKAENVNRRQVIENGIFELIDGLNSVSGDFLIKCGLPWRKKQSNDADDYDESNYFECIKRFEGLNDKYYVDKTEYKSGVSYIVTNKNADFYGYIEKWQMNCSKCEDNEYDLFP
eukprot:241370_1